MNNEQTTVQVTNEPDKKVPKFSYSKLGTYKDCPFKYKLQYVDGNYVYVGNIATEFGNAIHEAEEAIGKAIQAKQEINYTKIKNELIMKFLDIEIKYGAEYFADDGKSGRNYKTKAYEYLKNGIKNLENFMLEHPTYEIVGLEQKFNFVYDKDHAFNGAIDRVFHDTATDTYLIQDIKSWAVPAEEKDLTTPLQFVVYVMAAKSLWNADPEQITCQYYLPLVDNGLIQDGGTKGFMSRGTKKIEELFKNIQEENFKPNPSTFCHWCNFCPTNQNAPEKSKYLCPYFMKWTREHKTFEIENNWTENGIKDYPLILENYHKKYGIKC